MGPKTDRLIALLDQSVARLRDNRDDYHADRVKECRDLLARSDFRGITHTLTVFHPKGSLNDIEKPPLGALSHEVWTLADAIRREVERESRRER